MKQHSLKLTILMLVVFLPGWAWAGTKEEIIRLQKDVLQLQNQIRLLQKSNDDNGGVILSLLEQLNDQIARTNLQMESLSEALQEQKVVQGTVVEELRKDLQTLSVKWDDTNSRIASLQGSLQENQVKIQSLRQTPGTETGAMEADQVYSTVYNDFLMGNYDMAIAGFQDFLSNYPDSEYSDNAAYYLGVCYQEAKRYEQAISAFDQVIGLYPNGDKTPQAYYKKAAALEETRKSQESVETLRKLVAIFPDSQEAILAGQDLEKLGLNQD